MKKKIGIIGSFCLDHIFLYEGGKRKGIGGIYWSLIILSNLIKDSGTLYIYSKIGEDFYSRILNTLGSYKNIDTGGLIKVSQPHNNVYLHYYSKLERREFSVNVLPHMRFTDFKFSPDLDFLFINFISGRELKLQTLQKIRKSVTCPVYIDFHSLSLGIRKDGLRYMRPFPGWKQWLKCGDIIQMNEKEGALLFGKELISKRDYLRFGKQILSNGSKVFLLTLGEKGSFLLYKDGRKYKDLFIPMYKYEDSEEVTGCGDAYAGGFISEYARSSDIVKSAFFAGKVAGYKASLPGSKDLNKFRHFER
ncbi:carbohydrate kinase family protein [bacterium]|nr:carbohydrate kinase family protein [bacterium]